MCVCVCECLRRARPTDTALRCRLTLCKLRCNEGRKDFFPSHKYTQWVWSGLTGGSHKAELLFVGATVAAALLSSHPILSLSPFLCVCVCVCNSNIHTHTHTVCTTTQYIHTHTHLVRFYDRSSSLPTATAATASGS